MALTGTFETYTPVFSETEYTYTSLSVPNDISVDDPYYVHRGTTIIQSQSAVESVETSSVSGYISVYQFTSFKSAITGDTYDSLAVWYNVYNNEASRSADWNNWSSQGEITFSTTLAPEDDVRSKGYELLKSQDGWGNLTDA